MFYVFNHPYFPNGARVYEHRLKLAEKLRRPLRPGEVSHHEDEKKRNNKPSNLKLKTAWKHTSDHATKWHSKMTPEQKKEWSNNISKAKKGKPQPWAHISKMKGVKRSDEFKRKVSEGTRRYRLEHPKEVKRWALEARKRREKIPPRTHCKNGHELSPENTFCGDGKRCKICHREYKKEKRAVTRSKGTLIDINVPVEVTGKKKGRR